jgi:soluble lytic murein transglycosylase-like protein
MAAHADCIDDAARHHQVNPLVLRAIGWQESRLQPLAVGRNANGSVDVGAFQINSVHLPELQHYGITRTALADGCTSAEVAAWHYRRQVERQGNSWLAIGAYHSAMPARAAWYANRIAAILMRWNALPPGALPFPSDVTRAPGRPPPPARAGVTRAPVATTSAAASMPPARLATPPPSGSTSASVRTGPSEPSGVVVGTNVADFRELAYLPPAR